MDYSQNTPVTFEFKNCNTTQCHCIPIVNDELVESNEIFYVTLEAADILDRNQIVLDPVSGTIEILECKYVFYEYNIGTIVVLKSVIYGQVVLLDLHKHMLLTNTDRGK